jgi:hypothetical protein
MNAPERPDRSAHDRSAHEEEQDQPMAAPPGSVPDDLAAGSDPMPEIPGGPQVDVPAAQGHRPADPDEDRRR